MPVVNPLRSPAPKPDSPFVDPETGRIQTVWYDWLIVQSARTGGDIGPSAPLPSVIGDSTDAQVMAALGDVAEPAAAVAAQDDWIGAMADVPAEFAPGQEAMLAMMLGDWS